MNSEQTGAATRVRLQNSSESIVSLQLEPWGESYEMAPGEAIDVSSSGTNDPLDISVQEGQITVWAGDGAMIRVFRGGTELGSTDFRFRTFYTSGD